jgi:hypothetical protein
MAAQLLEVDAQSPQTLQVEVESWAAQLEEVHTRIAHCFARALTKATGVGVPKRIIK